MAIALITIFILVIFVGPYLSPYSPIEIVSFPLEAPSRAHWLGTDELGRDELTRLLVGGRISLAIALTAALAAALVGTAVGLVAGYRGGIVDALLMRITDALLALPVLPILLVLAAVDFEKIAGSLQTHLEFIHVDWVGIAQSAAAQPWLYGGRLVFVLTLFGWMSSARLVRAQVRALREADFVLAARACGAGGWRICVRHLLPHCRGPLLVASAQAVGGNLLYEAVLGFLGLGIPPPTPTWGGLLQAGRVYGEYRSPWLLLAPGLCVTLSVVAVNVLADRRAESRSF